MLIDYNESRIIEPRKGTIDEAAHSNDKRMTIDLRRGSSIEGVI